MSTPVQVKPKSDEVPPNNSVCSHETDSTSTTNDVESLKKRIIETSKNKAKAPHTILLVGETGVGKSSVLELIANVLLDHDMDHYSSNILNHTNEQGGLGNQSRTNSVRLYDVTSNGRTVVHILDTPGFTDPRRPRQDGLHKESFASQIEKYIDSITAILVLANGTIPGVTVGTDHALSSLSSILPKTLANNIAIVLTNVESPLCQNFSWGPAPDALKDAPRFWLNNPISLQRKYLELKGDLNIQKRRANCRSVMEAAEWNALEMLANLFDWLDGLVPHPATEMVPMQSITAATTLAL